MLLLWLLVLAVLPPTSSAAASGLGWRMPVTADAVAGGFRFDRAHPFAPGQRRGVDLRARPGASVTAACGGTVTYAGPAPGRGLDVTVRCGRLAATHLGLGAVAVGRGTRVVPGQPIGTVGRRGVVRLGARERADRWGWVDPLALVDDRDPLPPVPAGRAPQAPRAPRAPRVRTDPSRPLARAPLPRLAPVSGRVATRPVDPRGLLVAAGLVLLAAGTPLHGALWRGRRARPGRRVGRGVAESGG